MVLDASQSSLAALWAIDRGRSFLQAAQGHRGLILAALVGNQLGILGHDPLRMLLRVGITLLLAGRDDE